MAVMRRDASATAQHLTAATSGQRFSVTCVVRVVKTLTEAIAVFQETSVTTVSAVLLVPSCGTNTDVNTVFDLADRTGRAAVGCDPPQCYQL